MNVWFQCLGITGLVFVFYGLLSFAVTRSNDAVFKAILVAGLAFLAAFVAGFFAERKRSQKSVKELILSKNLRVGLGSVVYTGLVLFTVFVVIMLSERYYSWQKDFTKNSVHTLSEQTVKAVKNLTEPLTLTVFYDERNQLKPEIRGLLGKYEAVSGNVKVAYVDPDKDAILAQKYGAKDGDIVIEYKGQHHATADGSEQGLTQAILKVNRSTLPVVCFTTGHGEASIDAAPEAPRSYSFAKKGLENDGFAAKTVPLTGGVPKDCGILVIAGPEQKLTENEAGAVDQFLAEGGKSIWLLDPVISDSNRTGAPIKVLDTGLESTGKKWGVDLGRNFILEKQVQIFRGVQVVLNTRASTYGDHPVVEPLKGRQTVFERTRSVKKDPAFGGTAIEVIMTAGDGVSWAQSDVDALFRHQKVAFSPGDLQGPVPIAVVSERDFDVAGQKKKAQLVVIGDSDFASNPMIQSYEFNFDLLLNAVSWLAGEDEQISIRPKMFESSAVELTPSQANTIFYVAIVLLPMLVLTFGLNLWWYRRRKG